MASLGTLLTQKPQAPVFRRIAQGYIGTRWYRVNTVDEMRAVTAAGVPQYGDSWSLSAPNLRVISAEPEYQGGDDDPTTQEGGLTYVRVEYATPGLNGSLPPIGTTSTQIVGGNGSVQVQIDQRTLNGDTGGGALPLNNSIGVPKRIGSCQALVTTWPDSSAAIDFPRLLELHAEQATNADDVTLPPILGTEIRLSLAVGQGSYVTFEISQVGGHGRLVHVLELSRDFIVRWKEPDATGNFAPGAPVHEGVIYASLPFAGLW